MASCFDSNAFHARFRPFSGFPRSHASGIRVSCRGCLLGYDPSRRAGIFHFGRHNFWLFGIFYRYQFLRLGYFRYVQSGLAWLSCLLCYGIALFPKQPSRRLGLQWISFWWAYHNFHEVESSKRKLTNPVTLCPTGIRQIE